MKILLINALITKDKSFINLGTSILGTILHSNGYEVEIIDFNYLFNSNILPISCLETFNYDIMGNFILSKEPDIVCFSTMINSYHISIILADYIKSHSSEIKVIFGGPQASLCAYETMKNFDCIDIIVIGEGEKKLLNVVEAFNNHFGFSHLNGICYKKDNTIILKENCDKLVDLDTLPYINFDLIPYANKIKSFPLDVGRGCPYNCKYCSTKSFWKRKYRLKSSSRIILEIKHIIQKYNVKRFQFQHDLFTANKHKVLDFCNSLINEKLDIKWSCSCRIDTLDKEMIKKMSLAGCDSIFLGIETGSQYMQKVINKNLNLSNIWEIIDLLQKYKFRIKVSFIYGFPEEKQDDIRMTLAVIKRLLEYKITDITIGYITFLPSTQYYDEYKDVLTPIEGKLYTSFLGKNEVGNHKDLYLKYPTIFTQFYTVNTPDNIISRYLNKFITYFVRTIYEKYNLLYKYLMEFYEDDLFGLYLDMRDNIEKMYSTIMQYENNKIVKTSFIKLIIKSIEEFIYSKSFNENTKFFRQIFKFENDLNNFIYLDSDKDTYYAVYDYDFLEIKKTLLPMNNYIQKTTSIKLLRNDSTKIKIQKILLAKES